LLVTLSGSLLTLIYLSHSITLHVVFGVAFMVLLVAHLYQRRRTVVTLARQFWRGRVRTRAPSRLAVSDTILSLLILNVLVSGVVDALNHQATQLSFLSNVGFPPGLVQWHKLASFVAVIYAIVHVIRRRSRLRHSRIQ
jgi:uncharacterized protein YebE (UPF0316 family)